ncbi:MAG: Protein FdrA [Pseudomonadota bacterium]
MPKAEPKKTDAKKAPAKTALPGASLLNAKPVVINVGLQGFAEELAKQGVTVTHVDWSPPAGGDVRLANLLAKLGT